MLGIGAAASLLLGHLGFREADGEAGPLTLLYRVLQLFMMGSGDVDVSVPWELQVARFLAPAVSAGAAVSAVLAIAHEQMDLLRVGRLRDHVIVCGLGEKGALLARSFRENGRPVVAIERDSANEFIEEVRLSGAYVIVGDAQREEVLRRAGAIRAGYLIAVCGSDGSNTEVAIQAEAMSENRERGALNCLAHTVDPRVCLLLRTKELSRRGTPSFRLDFFNVFESGARALLEEYPPFRLSGPTPGAAPRMVLVGFGLLGEALALQAARAWRDLRDDQRPLKVTIVDEKAEAKADATQERHRELDTVWELTALDMPPESAAAGVNEITGDSSDFDAPTVAYVCGGDDRSTLAAGLSLQNSLGNRRILVVLVLTRSEGVARLVSESGTKTEFENLRAFGLFDRALNADLLIRGTYETLAHAMHEEYVREQAAKGETRETNPSLKLWEDLPQNLKESNRAQASHIGEKLRSIDCTLVPIIDSDAWGFEFAPAEVEWLAEMEHVRWVAERERDSWVYAPGKKDIERKTSPDLQPWEDLTEEAREKDRVFIRGLPRFLAREGFQIVRLDGAGAPQARALGKADGSRTRVAGVADDG
ncbi:MAG TPA: NAD-binding protein [Dehalococcoidia bacterium]|nr:NAD-binding protein [Dehalococcoidia bacterium]